MKLQHVILGIIFSFAFLNTTNVIYAKTFYSIGTSCVTGGGTTTITHSLGQVPDIIEIIGFGSADCSGTGISGNPIISIGNYTSTSTIHINGNSSASVAFSTSTKIAKVDRTGGNDSTATLSSIGASTFTIATDCNGTCPSYMFNYKAEYSEPNATSSSGGGSTGTTTVTVNQDGNNYFYSAILFFIGMWLIMRILK